MELTGNSYMQITQMPVYELTAFIEWKINFDKKRKENEAKAMEGIK